MTITLPNLQSTGRAGQEYPALGADGLPVDRTICPRCLGMEPERMTCHVCRNAPVCPGCRNARVLSIATSRFPAYRVCPTCCEPLTDSNGREERTETGLPLWLLFLSKQRAAVADYQRSRRQEYDDVPF